MADKLLLNVEDLIAALDDKAAELDDIIKRGQNAAGRRRAHKTGPGVCGIFLLHKAL